MAFDRTKLALVSASMNPSAPRVWNYVTDDAVGDVNTEGYFNDAADLLTAGDRIDTKSSASGTASYDTLYVNANDGSTVDVDDGSAFDGGTDSD